MTRKNTHTWGRKQSITEVGGVQLWFFQVFEVDNVLCREEFFLVDGAQETQVVVLVVFVCLFALAHMHIIIYIMRVNIAKGQMMLSSLSAYVICVPIYHGTHD